MLIVTLSGGLYILHRCFQASIVIENVNMGGAFRTQVAVQGQDMSDTNMAGVRNFIVFLLASQHKFLYHSARQVNCVIS